ncbi:signal transduction histidine kinase [Nocardia tenerifensis]|uniref:histidine kinase n=1 Tax=Nocardia tenerifensis TaxID=228006 RepID=A0A318K6U6_9NOCA|nr:histidine kinase [Nocardia tenerifensis]PXX64353.1 signal transduction histidine kinase [Nocardia tenerifensis]
MDIRWRRDVRLLARCLPLAVVPLLLLASTFPGQYRVPWSYWVLAMLASALFVVGDRWPLAVSLALSILAVPMFRTPAWGLSGLVPFLGAVALVEVAMRTRANSRVALAAACWALAVVLGRWGSHEATLWGAATVVEAGTYVGVPLLLGLYLRGQRDLAATLRLRAADAENRRAEAESRTRAAERGAMARELHDLIAHHMASIVLRVGIARHVVADQDPRVNLVLDDVRETAADALADIRRLLAALRDPALGEVALVDAEAVRAEISAAVRRVEVAGFVVEAEIAPELAGLDAIGRLTLLRLVQESLTNVMKHAEPAGSVRVEVLRRGGGIALRVRSGVGVSGAKPAGHGIIGMRERVELAGGTLAVGAAGGGWEVDAWLPGVEAVAR